MRGAIRAAALNVVLGGCFLVLGTFSLLTGGLLAWLWVIFGAGFTGVAFMWMRARREQL